MPGTDGLDRAVAAMERVGVNAAAIGVFARSYRALAAGETGLLAESDLEPVESLPRLADLDPDPDPAALAATAVIKVNGGLGTSMGMDRAKSLLPVRDGKTFLDITVTQVLAQRERAGARLPLLFMDSFRTGPDTLAALQRYPELAVSGLPADFRQSQEPKLRADDLTPVSWPADPGLEWCPPGHGDLYAALYAAGLLKTLRNKGFRYLFVANSDNLGAWPDPRLAAWFADSRRPFAAEYCQRTAADRKGGHLARRRSDGRLVLRESAQTRPADSAAFADVHRHRFFNCNNLWLDVDALAARLADTDGVLGLPVIRNLKTVDPTDRNSPQVIQIETAMGAAISVFDDAGAIEVDRSRFLPVKSTSDLLVLRSDAYDMSEAGRVTLAAGLTTAPLVDLDPVYAPIHDFDQRFPAGPPSLRGTRQLTVRGDWTFGTGVAVQGTVTLGPQGSPGTVADGARLGDDVQDTP